MGTFQVRSVNRRNTSVVRPSVLPCCHSATAAGTSNGTARGGGATASAFVVVGGAAAGAQAQARFFSVAH